MCREEASELASIRDAIHACGVRMAAVVKESLGVAAFAETFWRSDEIFLDEDTALYKAMFSGKLNKVGLSNFLGRAIYSNYYRASSKGYAGDSAGEGRILGGLFIVSMKGIHYEYPERTSGDHASVEEVVEVIKSLAPPGTDFSSLSFEYARTAAVAAAAAPARRALPPGAIPIGVKRPKTLDDARAEGQKMLEKLKARSATGSSLAPTPSSATAAEQPASPVTPADDFCPGCEPMEMDAMDVDR
ncbi:hypothetical protein DFJ74DRAFT_679465 [Hyaloraphidium curvatum]|nr:hypothetical protein DFJ74DRAFT_679465 [Hyaloraphidium curvatum]